MKTFVANLFGYMVAFMLGCIFTVQYVDNKVEVTPKTATTVSIEKVNKVIEGYTAQMHAEEAIQADLGAIPDTAIVKTHMLAEVTVIGAANHLYKVGKAVRIDDKAKVKANARSIINHKTNMQMLTFSNPNLVNLFTGDIEPTARAPGYMLAPVLLTNKTIKVMLRKEKETLKSVLKMIFRDSNYIKIADNGNITVKKHWYSRNKFETSVTELVTYIIPRQIVFLSKDLAEDYVQAINEEKTNATLVNTVYKHFSNFCTETGYLGMFTSELYHTPKWKKFLKSTLKKIKQPGETKTIQTLKALPSHTVNSFKSVIEKEQEKYKLRSVGICMTGIPLVDGHMQKVYRLV